MKKLAILIATMLMLCVMATACGGEKDNSTDAGTSSNSTVASSTAAPDSTSASTAAPDSTNPPVPAGTLATSCLSTDVVLGNFSNGVELAGGFIANGVSKDIVVDGSSAVSFGSYTGVSNRIKLGGSMDTTFKNSIKFTVDKACTLTVYAKSGSGSAADALTRAGWVLNSAGTQVGDISAPFAASGAPSMAMFEIPAAGTYYFGGNVNSINVYYISVVG